MMQALRDLQVQSGAMLASQEAATVPSTFGNDAIALQAAREGVALCDRSHWGRILVSGADRLRFLHNQTTNDFNALQPGRGCDTVFVTSTARTIDLATAYALEDAVLLLTSPGYSQQLMQWMDRYIFFADKVELKDLTEAMATFSLVGPASDAVLEKLGGSAIAQQPYGSHQLMNLNGVEVRVAVGSGLALPGYTLILDVEQAAPLWDMLMQAEVVPLGEQAWERLRIEQGRPAPGHELTEEVNPLEAGLWQTISLSKGCYIGQETIARLHTYKGVKQQLWGIRLTAPAEPGSTLMAGEEKIGKLTSCVASEPGYFGLAYIRTKVAEAGLEVQLKAPEAEHEANQTGELIALPFVSHDYP